MCYVWQVFCVLYVLYALCIFLLHVLFVLCAVCVFLAVCVVCRMYSICSVFVCVVYPVCSSVVCVVCVVCVSMFCMCCMCRVCCVYGVDVWCCMYFLCNHTTQKIFTMYKTHTASGMLTHTTYPKCITNSALYLHVPHPLLTPKIHNTRCKYTDSRNNPNRKHKVHNTYPSNFTIHMHHRHHTYIQRRTQTPQKKGPHTSSNTNNIQQKTTHTTYT